jgi:DNA-binding transcriptional ArsR family regulator
MSENHFTNNIYSFSNKEIVNNSKVNFLDIKKTASIIRAVNHKLRQSIVKLLEENKQLTVTEIYVRLRIEQSVASQHLAILRRANFLKTERQGKKIFYSLNDEYLDHVNKFIADLLEVQD